jgi:hypothetical protein
MPNLGRSHLPCLCCWNGAQSVSLPLRSGPYVLCSLPEQQCSVAISDGVG